MPEPDDRNWGPHYHTATRHSWESNDKFASILFRYWSSCVCPTPTCSLHIYAEQDRMGSMGNCLGTENHDKCCSYDVEVETSFGCFSCYSIRWLLCLYQRLLAESFICWKSYVKLPVYKGVYASRYLTNRNRTYLRRRKFPSCLYIWINSTWYIVWFWLWF